MLSSRLLKTKEKHSCFYYKTEPFFTWLEISYTNALNSFMEKRWLVHVIMIVSVFLIYLIGSSLQSELAPIEDRGDIRVQSTMPEGTSFQAMDRYITELTNIVKKTVPETEVTVL